MMVKGDVDYHDDDDNDNDDDEEYEKPHQSQAKQDIHQQLRQLQ